MERIVDEEVFKTECHHLLDEVDVKKHVYTITRRGRPFAKLIPIDKERASLFGSMRGTTHIKGDIVGPTDEKWWD